MGYQDFPSENFCLTVPNSFVVEYFCAVFHKNSGSEKLYGKKSGVSRISDEKFSSEHAENFRKGNLLCCVSQSFR